MLNTETKGRPDQNTQLENARLKPSMFESCRGLAVTSAAALGVEAGCAKDSSAFGHAA